MFRISTVKPAMYFLKTFFLIIYLFGNKIVNANVTTVNPPANATIKQLILVNTTQAVFPPVQLKSAKNDSVLNQTVGVGAASGGERKEQFQFPFFRNTPVIGSACSSADDCNSQINSTCLSGTCQCKPDFVASTNKRKCLLKPKKLQDPCTEDVQCDQLYNNTSGLAVCLSFNCVCSANAVLIDNKCYKKTVLGSLCKSDKECSSIPYSYCFQGVCACDPDFSPDENGTHCYPINGTNSLDCSQSSIVCEVLGTHAYCLNGTCVCFPGYHLTSGKCVYEKSLGEFCDSDDDCIVDMKPKEPSNIRVCTNNKCSCIKGYNSLTEHNLCESGSSIITNSLLLVLVCLFLLFK